MNKISHDLAKIADELLADGFIKESRDMFFTAVRLAHKDNPLVPVLEEYGFKPSDVFEYGDDDQLDRVHQSDSSVHKDTEQGAQEIWIHADEGGEIEYGYMEDSPDGHQHKYFSNLEDLVAHIAEEKEDCGCGCGGSCKEALNTMIAKYASKDKKKNVKLNKPFRTPDGPKKFSVYVKNEKGNVVKVNFGDPNMRIKKNNPKRRKSFRARHNCENPGPKWKARFWSCKNW
jgi:hypothetical protein